MAGVALMTLGWIWWRAWSPLVARGAAALCVAGVALNTSTFVLRGRRGAYDTGLDLVARLEPVSRPWRRGTFRGRRGTCSQAHINFVLHGRRGTWRHQRCICVAGVALMTLGWIWRRFWACAAVAVCASHSSMFD